MSEIQNRARFDFSDLDSVEPEPTTYKMPFQLRGERLDQPQRATYVFKDGYVPLSLCVFHQQRMIVIKIDVSTIESISSEWPQLATDKFDFASQLLPQLRARFGRHKKADYQIQGPFIPHEQGIAVATLLVRVGLDSNFDDAYQIAKRFLELHPDNEEIDRFKEAWAKPERRPLQTDRRHDCYQWTNEELRAIESMAPIDPLEGTFGFDRTEEERTRFNEIVWRQCQQRLNRNREGSPDDEITEVAVAANELLKSIFAQE